MLNLIVKRGASANGGTEGEIYVNDEKFGFTIEDVNRYLEQYLVEGSNDYTELLKHKIPGKTCIPAGEYEIKMSWSPRFNKMMPEIMDVPGYTGVRLHPANRAEELEGCVSVGYGNATADDDYIENSRKCFEDLMSKYITPAFAANDRVFIKIINP